MAKTFTFEEASAPSTFTFEEALGPAGGADAGLIQSARSAPMLYGEDPINGPMQPQSSMPAVGPQTAVVTDPSGDGSVLKGVKFDPPDADPYLNRQARDRSVSPQSKMFTPAQELDRVDAYISRGEKIQAALKKAGYSSVDEFQAARQRSSTRQRIAEELPVLSAVASGAANQVAGLANFPQVTAEFVNTVFVDPVLTALGGSPMPSAPKTPGTESLMRAAADYMPKVGKKEFEDVVGTDEFRPWLIANMAQNSPQMVMSLASMLAPAVRPFVLPGMGATSAGNAYLQGDDPRVAMAKGAVEVGSEMLPLGVFDKIQSAIASMPRSAQKRFLADVGKRVMSGGAAVAATALTGGAEEWIAQYGGNVLDKYAQGKNIPLDKGAAGAYVLGAAMGTGMGMPHIISAMGDQSPQAQAERELAALLNGGQFSDLRGDEFANLNPNLAESDPGPTSSDQPASAADIFAQRWGKPKPAVPDPVATVQSATSIDGAITAAAQAVDAAFNERDRQQAKSEQAVSNIARILGTEIPDVGTAAAVPGVVEPAAGGGAPDGAPGVGAGVGAAGVAGQPVDAGGVGGQPTGRPVPLGAGQPGALNFAQPPGPVRQITVTPAGTLTAIGDPQSLVRLLKSAGVTNVIPATNGITVGKSQASMARKILDDFVAAPPENFEQDFQQELEREYQADIKAQLLAKRNPQPAKVEKKTQSPLRTMLRTVGIKPELAADITGEKNKVRANNVLPFTFRKNGVQIDELVRIARERGFLTQDEDDISAGRRLIEMIQADLRGDRQESTETIDDAMRGEQDADVARAAARYGLDISGMEIGQVANAVNRIERRLEKARADGLRREAAAEARLEREAIQAADRLAAGPDRILDDLDDVPENNATLEDAMRALGFTEQEISDAVAQESRRAQADRAGSGDVVAAAAGPAQGSDRRGEGQARQEAGGAESRPQDLLGDAPNASQQAAARLRAEREEQDRRRQQAAPDAGGFMLSGSDRARDVGAAAGQGDLLGFSDGEKRTAASNVEDLRRQLVDLENRIVGAAGLAPGFIEDALRSRKVPAEMKRQREELRQKLRDARDDQAATAKPFTGIISDEESEAGQVERPLYARGDSSLPDEERSQNFRRWSNDAPLVTSSQAGTYQFKSGRKVVVEAFHGTKRPDQVGTVFQRNRATSGPMAFFTSSPLLASSYAEGKQDTSLSYEEQDYANWFKYKPKGERTPVDIVRAWYRLPAETKKRIADLAPRVRFSEEQEEDGGNKIELGPEDHASGTGSYDYNLDETKTRFDPVGNPLKALVEDWLNSANLFNDEERFLQVLRLAGFPVNDIAYDSPHSEYPFVYKAYVFMQKPLVTSDIPQEVRDALNAAAKRDRSRPAQGGADMWDKNTRSLREWVAAFNGDRPEYVWTSIPDKVTEVFKSLGYDGIIDWSGKGGGTEYPVYIPFEETQVKSAIGNKGNFNRDKKDILLARSEPSLWYSELSRKIGEAKMNASNPEGWKAFLSGLPQKGVKPDEIEWSGVREWLDLQQGKVTKQQVLDYLGANGVQVKEVTLGTSDTSGERETLKRYGLTVEVNPEDPGAVGFFNSDMDIMTADEVRMEFGDEAGAAARRIEGLMLGNESNPKYATYQLPGGQNYREVLLTLPGGAEKTFDQWLEEKGIDPIADAEPALREQWKAELQRAGSTQYRSNHWDQPNILAHIRLNDRTDAQGRRVLFVEEIQSDWAQAGRKHGINKPKTQAERAEMDAIQSRVSAGTATMEDRRRYTELTDRSDRVPSAPFIDSTDKWLTLALKRVMVMAAQEGYDAVAFVNGEQSAERYDLSKQVRSITWTGRGNDTEKSVTITPNSGNDIEFMVQPDGAVGSMSGRSIGNEFDGKRLDEIVGKDVAERIMGEPYGDMRGNGLKVGGQGMIAFYDKIVPAAVNKLLGKVGGGKIADGMVARESAYPREFPSEAAATEWAEANLGDHEFTVRGHRESDGTFIVFDEFTHKEVKGLVGRPQPGFDITPDMRETLAGGLPLFGREDRMPSGLTMQQARDRIREMRGADIGQVRAIVDSIRKTWKGGPSVEVVASYRDLPGRPVPRARGMYIGGKVYVVASSHRSGGNLRQAVAKTLSHEVIAHYGLRKILGADFDRLLTKPLQLAIASGNKPMTALREQVRRLYVDEDGNYTLSKREEADEIAARAVENAIDAEGNFRPGYSWLKSVWARVAQFLRDRGIDVPFTQAELQGMLVQAQQAVRKGERLAGASTVVVTQQPVLSRRSAEDVAPAEGFWSKIKAGKSFTPQEIADAYARGVRGTVRAFAGFSGEKGGMAAVPGTEHAGWRDEIAGFDGYVTVGVSFADGSLAMGVIPRELYPGRGSALGLGDLGEYSLATYAFTPNPDGSYRLDVFDPRRGGRVFDELARRGRLEETGDTDVAGQPYYRAVFDNRYTTSHSLIQEAVRRLGYHLGSVPTVVQIGRDTGSRANPGKEQVRTFTPEFIERRLARGEPRDTTAPVANPKDVAGNDSGRPAGDNPATEPDRTIESWRVDLAPALATAMRRWEAGRATDADLAAAVRAELDNRKAKREDATDRDRVRGSDWMQERILRARRTGQMSTAEADLALWLLNQAPQVATDLGISIKSGDMTKPNGTYNVLERVVTIFTSKSNPDTLTHEILHHTERMMPEPVQNAIRKEWLKQLEAESKKVRAGLERRIAKSEADPRLKQAVGADQQRIVLLDWMLEAARKGDADLASSLYGGFSDGISLRNVLPYEFSSPSEFWAVNAASLVRKRAEAGTSLWRQARQWLVELMQKAKYLLGLRSNAPVIHGLEAVLAGDGSFVTRWMISTGARELNDQTDTPAFRRWFGESVVTDNGKPMSEGGKPLVVYHGAPDARFVAQDGTFKTINEKYGANEPDKRAFWFASDRRVANTYADDRRAFDYQNAEPGIVSAYLSLQNPLIVDGGGKEWREAQRRGKTGDVINEARAAGHDGVIIRNVKDDYNNDRFTRPTDTFVVFSSNQIKSATENSGDFDPQNPDIRYALGAAEDLDADEAPAQRSRWLDDAGRLRFLPGTIAYDLLGKAATPLLNRVYLKTQSKPLRRAIREMKLTVQKAQDTAEEIGREVVKLTDAEREMVSDIIEKELSTGVVPPEHAVKLAATMNEVLGKQTDELVKLGMLATDTADQWRGKYLARYYKDKLGARVQSAWDKAISTFGAKPMRGLRGNHFKGRGLFEVIPEAELPAWEANGWEVRDPDYQEGITKDGTVRVWRDFTRAEREKMGEVRDAGFRFVMGYMETQKDIALGRMFQAIAADPELSSKYQTEELSEQVPDGTISGTGVKKYGKLAGRWVSKETISHLSQIEESQSEAFKMYRKAMGLWKETKTSLNPVAHANNIVSNITMAHFAGVSYWDGHKYAQAMRDFATKSASVQEAKDAGLFLGTVSDAELMNVLPEDLKAIVRQQEGTLTKVGSNAFNAMTWFLRRPMGAAYQAEDTFFRYLIWKDARDRGMSSEDAVDYSLRYIFAYDDLPRTARYIRDFGIPFFAYTYKAIPALLHTAANYPWRFAAPAAVMWGVNAAAYAIAVGDDDDDWIERLQKYLTDPAYREKAKAREKLEREYLPEWMKGNAIMGTPKAIRLGMDEVTKLPLFIDVYRMVPGGDMLDMNNNAGGTPWLQPFTPNHPLLTTYMAMFGNRDGWTGRDIVDKNDNSEEAAQKRLGWMWRQVAPALAYGNYHFERSMQALANATGKPVKWAPDAMGGMEATGIAKDGLPVQPKYAAMQTFGLKVRPIDVEMGEIYDNAARAKTIREIDAEMRRLQRLNSKGAVSDAALDREREKANLKKDRLNNGLTVDGNPR